MKQIPLKSASILLISLGVIGLLFLDAPSAVAESPISEPVLMDQSRVAVDADPELADLLAPEPTPQSEWHCMDGSFGTAIQCSCNYGGLGSGGLSCLVSSSGFTVETEASGGQCTALAICDTGAEYSCSSSSACSARIDTSTGAGYIDCNSRTNFTC